MGEIIIISTCDRWVIRSRSSGGSLRCRDLDSCRGVYLNKYRIYLHICVSVEFCSKFLNLYASIWWYLFIWLGVIHKWHKNPRKDAVRDFVTTVYKPFKNKTGQSMSEGGQNISDVLYWRFNSKIFLFFLYFWVLKNCYCIFLKNVKTVFYVKLYFSIFPPSF